MHACSFRVAAHAITVSLALTAASNVTAAPVEWSGNGHFYELIEHPEGTSWYEARDEAHERWHNGIRGHLATITSSEERQFIVDELLSGAPQAHYYIGGFQSDGSPEPDGGWEWLTGEPWGFTDWGSGEPNDNNGIEHVLEAYGPNSPKFGQWNDIPFDVEGGPEPYGGYIIEWPDEAPAYAHSFVNPANGHTYFVSDTMMTAPVAEAWARSLGGHLVTVNDAAENDWLHDTLAGAGYTHFWIGLTDEEAYGGGEAGDNPNGNWVWMSGEPVDYLNWNPAEPDGATYPGQDYVEMHISGNWNDLENITLRHGVAEVGVVGIVNPANGHTYYASTDFIRSFAEAEAWARSLGGHLVTINDADEQAWLLNTFGTDQEYWIGLTDSEAWGGHEAGSDPLDGWVWTSGEPVTYVNWYPGEPNNDDGVEDYVEMNYLFTEHGYWNDVRDVNQPLFIALAEVGNPLFLPGGSFAAGIEPSGVAAGDLDNDGDEDLVAANTASADISVLLNSGDATFATQVRYDADTACNSVAVGDLNGDGHRDVVATNSHGHNVSVFINEGDGTFEPQVKYGVGGWPQAAVIADLDGDGDPDLAVANILSDDVSILLNDGTGSFTDHTTYPAGDGARHIAASDLDGDGDLDLAVPNEQVQTVSILLNAGDASFATRIPYGAGNHPYAVAIADLDGDGDDDLAVANLDSNTASVLVNNGDATFAPQVIYPTGSQPRAVSLDDLDEDGDVDLTVADRDDNAVSVLLNNGDGGLIPDRQYDVSNHPHSMAVVDLDGDGDLDLATANSASDNVTILLNQTDPVQHDEFVLIPGGSFEMGDHHGVGDSDELPVHDVYLAPYFMSVYETTNAQFAMFLNSAFVQGQIDVIDGVVYKADDDEPYCETTASSGYSRIAWSGSTFTVITSKDEHPMVLVSWYGSVAYANWLSSRDGLTPAYDLATWTCNFDADGYRLPTEAEWEFAARGGEHDPYYIYPWGNTIDGSDANFFGSGDPYEGDDPETTPVGCYDPNGYGLFDMSGNAWEWCYDWYDEDYYATGPHSNPTGPTSGSYRVLRSGSWEAPTGSLRTAHRNAYYPHHQPYYYGFRLVRPASLPDGALYVDDDAAPGGDGLTWGNAFRYLQDALDAARAGDTIRVAQGIYQPDESADHPDGTGDREATFVIRSDTNLEGGYAGLGGGDPDLRDPNTFVTILDGDLNDDDLPGFINATDNARHVVTADYDVNGALIDGFTIRRGYSDEDTPDPTISGGAGLLCEATQFTVRHCRFEWNHTGRAGGALYTRHGQLDVEHCTFQYNEGGFGAAVNSFSGTVTIIGSELYDNASDWHGGAIANEADLTLANCMLTRNVGGLGSGAISTAGNLTLLDCTLTQNTGPQAGGIRAVWWTESVTLRNSILWGNVDNTGQGQLAQFDSSGGDVDIDYCCIQGWTGGYGGTGNTGDDPAFRDELGPDGVWGSGDEDHHPASGSPCIDAGSNDLVPTFLTLDLDGQPRFTDDANTPDTGQGDPPIVDMGAFEWQHSPCWDADLNNDRVVNLQDLGILLAYYDWGDGGDVDGDGDTDLSDLGILLAHYDEHCN